MMIKLINEKRLKFLFINIIYTSKTHCCRRYICFFFLFFFLATFVAEDWGIPKKPNQICRLLLVIGMMC